MANIDNIVQVNASILAGGIDARNFGITLFVTDDDTLPPDDSLQIFANFQDVASVFPEGSTPYQAGQVYFDQQPYPKNFMVGRWINFSTGAQLVGGMLGALSTIIAISDGSLQINGTDVTGIDFTLDTTYNDIANTLEAALNVAGVGVTVEYDAINTNFIITTVVTGAVATLTYATPVGSGTDISTLLALTSTTSVSLTQGTDAETIADAMEKFQSINNIFYFITLDPTYNDTQTVIDLAQWLGTQAYMYAAESTSNQVLVTNDTTSNFALLFDAQSDRVWGDWNSLENPESGLYQDYLSVSSAARLSSIDFNGADTIINPNLKNRPDIQAAIITTTQTNELDRKRVNRFTPVGGGTTSQTVLDIYQYGYCFKTGIWQDVRYGVDWLVNAIQVAVFNLLYETDIVPQTPDGQAAIKTTIESVCQQGVVNGLMAAGQVSAATLQQIKTITGNSQFNGILPQGYLVYYLPLSTLSDQERIDRELPPFYVWCKGSGAVNSVDISVYFDQ